MKNIFPIFALAVLLFFCGAVLKRQVEKYDEIEEELEIKFRKREDILADAIKEKLQIKEGLKLFRSSDYNFKKKKRKEKINANAFPPYRKYLVQAGIYIDFFLGNKILPNGVVDLEEGYLTTLISKDSLQEINAIVKKMEHFKQVLDSLGIPLVYAQYPHVICSEDEISKAGKDQTIQAKNEFMRKLEELGIPVIDLHKEFHERANNNSKEFHHSLFYKTDHHWRVKTSIWAGKIMSEKLNELYGFGLESELLDSNSFTEKYTHKWLGSMGRKVIPLYSGEDFYIYSPEHATNINWLLVGDEGLLYESNGSFDSLYNFNLTTKEDQNAFITYALFGLSINNNLPDGKKILLIGDSFNMPLSKFLAVIFKEVSYVYHLDISGYYLANKPDVVVLGFDNPIIKDPPEFLIY